MFNQTGPVLMLFGRIGVLEILIILAVILLIFGPAKLPALAKAVGKSVVEFKDGLKAKSSREGSDPSSTPSENKQ